MTERAVREVAIDLVRACDQLVRLRSELEGMALAMERRWAAGAIARSPVTRWRTTTADVEPVMQQSSSVTSLLRDDSDWSP